MVEWEPSIKACPPGVQERTVRAVESQYGDFVKCHKRQQNLLFVCQHPLLENVGYKEEQIIASQAQKGSIEEMRRLG